MIVIDQLYKKYRNSNNFSVENFSLTVADREIFGLLGPNGAGKTTIISMLSALVKPSSGNFSINELTYTKNRKKLKQSIGIVPQEYALYPTLTAYENLHYFGSMYGLKGRKLTEVIQKHLKTLGLEEFRHKKIHTFSGGMKRRINLIASVLHEPQVLFLDEPTVGVDVQSKHVIIDYLTKLNAQGTTIVYTSHHLNEAEQFCDRVGIIDHGKLIAIGKPAELIASEEQAENLEDVFLSLTGKGLRDYA